MGALKYVCTSDVHFGEDVGLLTRMDYIGDNPEDWKPVYDERSPVVDALINCLEWLLDQVDKSDDLTLVLNGDVMELALTPMNKSAQVLVKETEKGLDEFFAHPVITQLLVDQREMGKPPVVPDDITFVFGHTHKPFAQFMHLLGSHNRVKVYNTGGWVIDSTTRAAKHGGAITLFDENLDGASIVMYREEENGNQFPVKVEPDAGDEMRNEFTTQIDQIISGAGNDPADNPWLAFAREVAAEVPKRRQFVKAIIDEYLSRIHVT